MWRIHLSHYVFYFALELDYLYILYLLLRPGKTIRGVAKEKASRKEHINYFLFHVLLLFLF